MAALRFYTDLLVKHKAAQPSAMANGLNDVNQLFMTGRAGMIVDRYVQLTRQAVASGARDLKEIARLIGTTRSTTHRLASCLVDERYLRVVPQIGYLLGPKLIELGFQAREELPLVTLAGPYLDELSALTGDTIHLAIREDDDVLYLHKNPGRNGPEMRSRVGHRMPLARTGIGKALLLDDPVDEWQRLYDVSQPAAGKSLQWPQHPIKREPHE